MCLPHLSSIFKKSVLKLLERTVYAMAHELKIMYENEMWGFSEAWKELDNVQTICRKLMGIPN